MHGADARCCGMDERVADLRAVRTHSGARGGGGVYPSVSTPGSQTEVHTLTSSVRASCKETPGQTVSECFLTGLCRRGANGRYTQT